MADPSPAADAPEGQEPKASEGQEPAPDGNDDGGKPDSDEEKEPKTYPESYVRQLRREAAQGRNRLAELEERLQGFEDRDKTEAERLNMRLDTAEKRASDAETRLLRYEVAAEHGLDAKAAAFLTGSTREELELRAEELTSLLADRAKDKPAAGFDGGARKPAAQKQSPERAHNDTLLRALGRETSR